MRMWMINPKLMCDKHLLGEHGELHKHRHNFIKKHDMSGRVLGSVIQIEVLSMKTRHDELHVEMERRFNKKYTSEFEMPDVSYLPADVLNKKCNIEYNLADLANRCEACRLKQQNIN